MKILYYNWVDYLDDEARGGGVSVYQQNLIRSLSGAHEVLFLCSGLAHDLRPGAPRWAAVTHGGEADRGRRFEIVNSGVLAPSHQSFDSPAQLSHAPTRAALFDFIEAHGPFDVIHFNNLEGIPADVLELKTRWPETRVVLSLHNYYPVCPQVNLWQNEARNCLDFEAGARCGSCLEHRVNPRVMRLAYAWAMTLKRCGLRPGTRGFAWLYGPPMIAARGTLRLLRRLNGLRRRKPAPAAAPVTPVRKTPTETPFAARRARMVALINRHCDQVLCVSERVRQIAAQHGVAPDLLKTSYIGTSHADKFLSTRPRPLRAASREHLQLGYLGYMRRDKGFFFLLAALEALPDDLARQVGLTIAAGQSDAATMARISRLGARLADLTYLDGYSHAALDDILAGIDVGVVPVLWEDNLPQVAIEMHARHIPLLTSNLGGAQELSGCKDMIFRADDVGDFHARLAGLITGGLDIKSYWAGARAPVSMADHIEDILAVYGKADAAQETQGLS